MSPSASLATGQGVSVLKKTSQSSLECCQANYGNGFSRQVVKLYSESILSSLSVTDVSLLQPGSQEDADPKIILHVSYFATLGITRMIVRTRDTDVVVPAVANVKKIPATEIWAAFGVEKTFNCIPAHRLCRKDLLLHSCTPGVSKRRLTAFLHTGLLLSLGHALHKRCRCLMPSQGVTPSPQSHLCIPISFQWT